MRAGLRMVAALVALLAVGGCGEATEGDGPSVAGDGAPADTVRAVVAPYLTYASLLVGQASGHFADQGLHLEIVPFQSGTQLTPLLLSGDLDILSIAPTPGFFRAAASGARIRIVADKGIWDPDACQSTVLLAHESLFEEGDGDPARALARPGRRRLSVTRNASAAYFVDRALDRVGLTPDRFDIVHIPAAAELEALADGSVAVTVTSEPWLTRALDGGHVRPWVTGAEAIPDFQFSTIAFGPTLLDERPGVGARVVAALVAAVGQLAEGKTDENVRILAEGTGQDEALMRRACWPSFSPDGSVDLESLDAFQAWLVAEGMLDTPVPSEDYWDGRFLREAALLMKTPDTDRDIDAR